MTTPGWKRKEQRSARRHGCKHIGGPGKADYGRGCVIGEVKHRKQPITKPQVIHEVRRARKMGACRVGIASTSGFTRPAEAHVRSGYKGKVTLMRA